MVEDTRLVGLLHKSKIPDEQQNLKEHFKKGQNLGLKILEVEGKKISLVLSGEASDDIGPMDALTSKELMKLAQYDGEQSK